MSFNIILPKLSLLFVHNLSLVGALHGSYHMHHISYCDNLPLQIVISFCPRTWVLHIKTTFGMMK